MIVRRLPDLGPRGEGWFVLQVALLGGVAAAGLFGPRWTGRPRVIGGVLGSAMIGAGGALAARGVVDLGEDLTVFPRPRTDARLVDSGAYRLVRHPIYGGLIVAATGWGLLAASPLALLATIVLGAFLGLKSRREEAWLAETFRAYAAYRRRTRRFVPWLY